MLRLIREVQPTWVVGENVSGLIGWNGGLVFDEVQADLESAGYEVQAFVLPACGVNAPHRRDRVWFVAYAIGSGTGNKSRTADNKRRATSQDRREGLRQTHGEIGASGFDTAGSDGYVAHSKSERLERFGRSGETSSTERNEPNSTHARIIFNDDFNAGGIGRDSVGNVNGNIKNGQKGREFRTANSPHNWHEWPTQPPIRFRDDGVPSELDGITVSKHRNESLKGAGNAIVPQIAHQIFKAIEAFPTPQTP